MGIDRQAIRDYEIWFNTPAGVYVDEKEKELLLEGMRFKRGQKVLEAGSGTGRYLSYLSDLELNVIGIEPVDELIQTAFLRSGITREMVIKADPASIPFGDNSFDSVFSVIAFQSGGDRIKIFREMYRVAAEKVGIGFLNKHSITNIFSTKERRRLYKRAAPLSGGEIKKIITAAAGGDVKNEDIKIRYSLYPAVNWGYMMPAVDNLLEKTNLPLGNFGMAVIDKNSKRKAGK